MLRAVPAFLAKSWNNGEYRSFQQPLDAPPAFIDRGAIDDYGDDYQSRSFLPSLSVTWPKRMRRLSVMLQISKPPSVKNIARPMPT